MKKWIKDLDKKKFNKSKYSQFYQADLLNYIFENLDVGNDSSFCVEFGYNSNSISQHANTTSLVLDKGWKSIFFDGRYENKEINLHKEFLTTDNIRKLFNKYKIPHDVEYISIDVDSTDLWLFDELLKEFRPKVYSVEYNPNFPIDYAITLTNNSDIFFNNDKAYGASLKALCLIADKYNYSLLWVVPTLDAFFIRNDLIDDGTSNISFPLSKWKRATNIPAHSVVKEIHRINQLIDLEAYFLNNKNLEISKKEAQKVVKKYIQGYGDLKTKIVYLRIFICKPLEILLKSHKIKKISVLRKFLKGIFLFVSPYPYNLWIHELN